MFYSHFGAAVAKIFDKIQLYSSLPKKFLKIVNLFSHPKLPGKKETKTFSFLLTSHDLSNFGKNLPFSENSDWKNNLRVSKTFFKEIFFLFVEYHCNRSSKMSTKNFKIVFQSIKF